ncbi:MAG: PaaX family transcriptional regulator C-terminal domain-containing protein [Spartobacteria bacterium]
MFLYTLMWGLNIMTRPTFRSMDQSFEGWAWSNGLLKRIRSLENEGLVAVDESLGEKTITLTQKGKLLAIGGFDPEALWNSDWDGKWRIITFDLPESQRKVRHDLRLTLRHQNFGCLQRSIWITPHPLDSALREKGLQLKSQKGFAIIEGVFLGGAGHESIVKSAWDFTKIDKLYTRHAELLKTAPKEKCTEAEFNDWASEELKLWREILHKDPFLPRQLQPKGYKGMKAREERLKVLANLKKAFPRK